MPPKKDKKFESEPFGSTLSESDKKRKATSTPGRGANKISKKDTDDVSIPDSDEVERPTDSAILLSLMEKVTALEVLIPLRDDVSVLADRLSQLESSLSDKLDEKLSAGFAEVSQKCETVCMEKIKEYDQSVSSRLSENTRRIEALMREQQVAQSKLTAVIQGIPQASTRESVSSLLKSVGVPIKSLRITTLKGKDMSMGFASFLSEQARDEFITSFKTSPRVLTVNGKTIEIAARPDKPKFLRDRNRVLSDKYNELSKRKGDKVSIDWAKRTILVNGNIRFRQLRDSSELAEVS